MLFERKYELTGTRDTGSLIGGPGKRGRIMVGLVVLCVMTLNGGVWATSEVSGKAIGTEVVTVEVSQVPQVSKGNAVPGAVPDFKSWPETGPVNTRIVLRGAYNWVKQLEPNEAGTLWLAVIVLLVVAFDIRRPLSFRNADLVLLVLPAFLLLDLVELGNVRLHEPGNAWWFQTTFLGIFIASLALLVRSLAGAFLSERPVWIPNLPSRLLMILTLVLFAGNGMLALGREPDDAGYYINLGAKRFLETGHLPYGDSVLRGGASATYGPLLYLAHVPFQVMLSTSAADSSVHNQVSNSRENEVAPRPFVRPPLLATKLTLLMFHLAGVVALVLIGRRLAGPAVGWSLACLYLGSAYVMGLGGDRFFITGMTYISHIAPAAVTLLAFAALQRPFLAGSLLAAAVGVLFYPAFFFPAWFGYLFWQNKKNSARFLVGFLVVLLMVAGFVLLNTQASENGSVLKVVYESTVGHQEAGTGYGASNFGFWGTHPRLAAFWQSPLLPGWHLLKPSFIGFSVLLVASFFLARGRTLPQLALLTAAVAIAIQLWKSHAGGTYVEWYYPFLLIGLFTQRKGGLCNEQLEGATQSPQLADNAHEP